MKGIKQEKYVKIDKDFTGFRHYDDECRESKVLNFSQKTKREKFKKFIIHNLIIYNPRKVKLRKMRKSKSLQKFSTFIFLFLFPLFLLFLLDGILAASEGGSFANVESIEEAEQKLVTELDKIFEKSLQRLQQMTDEDLDKEEEKCIFFDDYGTAEEHIPKITTKTECLAESSLDVVEKFSQSMLKLKDKIKPSESFDDALRGHSQGRVLLDKIMEDVRLALDMSLAKYDILLSQKTFDLKSQKKQELLKEFAAELNKLKGEVRVILEDKVIDASCSECI